MRVLLEKAAHQRINFKIGFFWRKNIIKKKTGQKKLVKRYKIWTENKTENKFKKIVKDSDTKKRNNLA
jgi:hypothetical protein